MIEDKVHNMTRKSKKKQSGDGDTSQGSSSHQPGTLNYDADLQHLIHEQALLQQAIRDGTLESNDSCGPDRRSGVRHQVCLTKLQESLGRFIGAKSKCDSESMVMQDTGDGRILETVTQMAEAVKYQEDHPQCHHPVATRYTAMDRVPHSSAVELATAICLAIGEGIDNQKGIARLWELPVIADKELHLALSLAFVMARPGWTIQFSEASAKKLYYKRSKAEGASSLMTASRAGSQPPDSAEQAQSLMCFLQEHAETLPEEVLTQMQTRVNQLMLEAGKKVKDDHGVEPKGSSSEDPDPDGKWLGEEEWYVMMKLGQDQAKGKRMLDDIRSALIGLATFQFPSDDLIDRLMGIVKPSVFNDQPLIPHRWDRQDRKPVTKGVKLDIAWFAALGTRNVNGYWISHRPKSLHSLPGDMWTKIQAFLKASQEDLQHLLIERPAAYVPAVHNNPFDPADKHYGNLTDFNTLMKQTAVTTVHEMSAACSKPGWVSEDEFQGPVVDPRLQINHTLADFIKDRYATKDIKLPHLNSDVVDAMRIRQCERHASNGKGYTKSKLDAIDTQIHPKHLKILYHTTSYAGMMGMLRRGHLPASSHAFQHAVLKEYQDVFEKILGRPLETRSIVDEKGKISWEYVPLELPVLYLTNNINVAMRYPSNMEGTQKQAPAGERLSPDCSNMKFVLKLHVDTRYMLFMKFQRDFELQYMLPVLNQGEGIYDLAEIHFHFVAQQQEMPTTYDLGQFTGALKVQEEISTLLNPPAYIHRLLEETRTETDVFTPGKPQITMWQSLRNEKKLYQLYGPVSDTEGRPALPRGDWSAVVMRSQEDVPRDGDAVGSNDPSAEPVPAPATDGPDYSSPGTVPALRKLFTEMTEKKFEKMMEPLANADQWVEEMWEGWTLESTVDVKKLEEKVGTPAPAPDLTIELSRTQTHAHAETRELMEGACQTYLNMTQSAAEVFVECFAQRTALLLESICDAWYKGNEPSTEILALARHYTDQERNNMWKNIVSKKKKYAGKTVADVPQQEFIVTKARSLHSTKGQTVQRRAKMWLAIYDAVEKAKTTGIARWILYLVEPPKGDVYAQSGMDHTKSPPEAFPYEKNRNGVFKTPYLILKALCKGNGLDWLKTYQRGDLEKMAEGLQDQVGPLEFQRFSQDAKENHAYVKEFVMTVKTSQSLLVPTQCLISDQEGYKLQVDAPVAAAIGRTSLPALLKEADLSLADHAYFIDAHTRLIDLLEYMRQYPDPEAWSADAKRELAALTKIGSVLNAKQKLDHMRQALDKDPDNQQKKHNLRSAMALYQDASELQEMEDTRDGPWLWDRCVKCGIPRCLHSASKTWHTFEEPGRSATATAERQQARASGHDVPYGTAVSRKKAKLTAVPKRTGRKAVLTRARDERLEAHIAHTEGLGDWKKQKLTVSRMTSADVPEKLADLLASVKAFSQTLATKSMQEYGMMADVVIAQMFDIGTATDLVVFGSDKATFSWTVDLHPIGLLMNEPLLQGQPVQVIKFDGQLDSMRTAQLADLGRTLCADKVMTTDDVIALCQAIPLVWHHILKKYTIDIDWYVGMKEPPGSMVEETYESRIRRVAEYKDMVASWMRALMGLCFALATKGGFSDGTLMISVEPPEKALYAQALYQIFEMMDVRPKLAPLQKVLNADIDDAVKRAKTLDVLPRDVTIVNDRVKLVLNHNVVSNLATSSKEKANLFMVADAQFRVKVATQPDGTDVKEELDELDDPAPELKPTVENVGSSPQTPASPPALSDVGSKDSSEHKRGVDEVTWSPSPHAPGAEDLPKEEVVEEPEPSATTEDVVMKEEETPEVPMVPAPLRIPLLPAIEAVQHEEMQGNVTPVGVDSVCKPAFVQKNRAQDPVLQTQVEAMRRQAADALHNAPEVPEVVITTQASQRAQRAAACIAAGASKEDTGRSSIEVQTQKANFQLPPRGQWRQLLGIAAEIQINQDTFPYTYDMIAEFAQQIENGEEVRLTRPQASWLVMLNLGCPDIVERQIQVSKGHIKPQYEWESCHFYDDDPDPGVVKYSHGNVPVEDASNQVSRDAYGHIIPSGVVKQMKQEIEARSKSHLELLAKHRAKAKADMDLQAKHREEQLPKKKRRTDLFAHIKDEPDVASNDASLAMPPPLPARLVSVADSLQEARENLNMISPRAQADEQAQNTYVKEEYERVNTPRRHAGVSSSSASGWPEMVPDPRSHQASYWEQKWAEKSKPHIPEHADQEMTQAGVGDTGHDAPYRRRRWSKWDRQEDDSTEQWSSPASAFVVSDSFETGHQLGKEVFEEMFKGDYNVYETDEVPSTAAQTKARVHLLLDSHQIPVTGSRIRPHTNAGTPGAPQYYPRCHHVVISLGSRKITALEEWTKQNSRAGRAQSGNAHHGGVAITAQDFANAWQDDSNKPMRLYVESLLKDILPPSLQQQQYLSKFRKYRKGGHQGLAVSSFFQTTSYMGDPASGTRPDDASSHPEEQLWPGQSEGTRNHCGLSPALQLNQLMERRRSGKSDIRNFVQETIDHLDAVFTDIGDDIIAGTLNEKDFCNSYMVHIVFCKSGTHRSAFCGDMLLPVILREYYNQLHVFHLPVGYHLGTWLGRYCGGPYWCNECMDRDSYSADGNTVLSEALNLCDGVLARRGFGTRNKPNIPFDYQPDQAKGWDIAKETLDVPIDRSIGYEHWDHRRHLAYQYALAWDWSCECEQSVTHDKFGGYRLVNRK